MSSHEQVNKRYRTTNVDDDIAEKVAAEEQKGLNSWFSGKAEGKAQDEAYDEAMARREAYKKEQEQNRLAGIEAGVMNNAKLRFAYGVAQDIAKLRGNSFPDGSPEAEENDFRIDYKEKGLNDRLAIYRDELDSLPDGPDKDAAIKDFDEAADFIIDATVEQSTATGPEANDNKSPEDDNASSPESSPEGKDLSGLPLEGIAEALGVDPKALEEFDKEQREKRKDKPPQTFEEHAKFFKDYYKAKQAFVDAKLKLETNTKGRRKKYILWGEVVKDENLESYVAAEKEYSTLLAEFSKRSVLEKVSQEDFEDMAGDEESGEKEQSPEKIAEMMTDLMYAEMMDIRSEVDASMDEQRENRNGFTRLSAWLGKIMNRPGKPKNSDPTQEKTGGKWVKQFGGGAVLGAGTAYFAYGTAFAGFPITAAVGAGVVSLARSGAKLQTIDANRDARQDVANAEGIDFAEIRQRYITQAEEWLQGGEHGSGDPKLKDFVENISQIDINSEFNKSREYSESQIAKVRHEAGRAALRTGLGFAAGGAIGNWATSKFGASEVSAQLDKGRFEISTPEPLPPPSPTEIVNVDLNGARYPWNWAAGEVGPGDAMNYLHELAGRATEAGHQVSWHPAVGGGEFISIDGVDATQEVVNILSQFK